ncbi:MAG: hypothetical protein K8S55_03860 [Phycisphaerae bacterium]|nr:hypothetical protein [Phycisphaerae bacterium]
MNEKTNDNSGNNRQVKSNFMIALLQLRLDEETACREIFDAAKAALDEIRVKIHAFDQAIAECRRAAAKSFAQGDDPAGRGNWREVQGLILQRAGQVGMLADAKARLAAAQDVLAEAMQSRKALGVLHGEAESQTPPAAVQTDMGTYTNVIRESGSRENAIT